MENNEVKITTTTKPGWYSKCESLKLSLGSEEPKNELNQLHLGITKVKRYPIFIIGPHCLNIGGTSIIVPEGKQFMIELLDNNEMELKTTDI